MSKILLKKKWPMKGEFGKFVWKINQCFESYGEMQNTFRRWNFDQTWKCFTKIWYDIGILLFFLLGVCEQSKTSQPNEKNILSIKVFLHTKGSPKQKKLSQEN